MFNKFIFIINAPRGGGVSISKLKRIQNNSKIFIWPYEFFYFNLFNEVSNNKKTQKIGKLNKFFFKEIKQKLNFFSKDKINFIKFKKKLTLTTKDEYNSIEYLNHLAKSLSCSYKKKNKSEKLLFVYTSARGFDWKKNNLKNFYFIKTDRSYFESFISIRENTIGGSSFYNFYNLEGKKSFFYWIETFRKIVLNHKENLPKKRFLNLKFESLRYSLKKRSDINDKNSKKILEYFKIKDNTKNKNFFFEVHKKKNKEKFNLSKIEKYLLENYIYQKKINFIKYFYYLNISIKFFICNFYKSKTKKKVIRLIKLYLMFFLFYFYIYKEKELYNLLLKGNPHIKFMGIWK